MAERSGREKKADLFVVALAALLHDIADWKFHNDDGTAGSKVTRQILSEFDIPESTITHICEIIQTMSFKGNGVPTPMKPLEGKVVRMPTGWRLSVPSALRVRLPTAVTRISLSTTRINSRFCIRQKKTQNKGTTIHHFYEKLLLLKGRMNTETARQIAEGRHRFMEQFLE